MTGLRVFRVCQQRGSTGRWGTLANCRAVSCGPVNTPWTRSSAGLTTSAVPEEQASHDRAGSGQVGSGVQDSLQWRQCCPWESCKDGVTVIQSRQHQRKSCSNITPELSTQRSESAQVEEACPRQLSHVLTHWQLLVDQHTKVSNDRHWFNVVLADASDFTPWWYLAKICRRTKPQNLCLCGVELQALRSAPRTDARDALFDDDDDVLNVGRNATSEALHVVRE